LLSKENEVQEKIEQSKSNLLIQKEENKILHEKIKKAE
jgi:hypothetical protein